MMSAKPPSPAASVSAEQAGIRLVLETYDHHTDGGQSQSHSFQIALH
jgi:hypothetical protein